MRVVKINAIWCSGCLVMNKVWNHILKQYDIETVSLDYDMDEELVLSYHPGDILPVFIFFDRDNEIGRISGEVKEKELLDFMKGIGFFDKEGN